MADLNAYPKQNRSVRKKSGCIPGHINSKKGIPERGDMMIRFSEDGNTETKQSAQATAEHAGRFGALARANSWYDHAMVTDPIAAGRQQNAPEGVTSEEKASLGASW